MFCDVKLCHAYESCYSNECAINSFPGAIAAPISRLFVEMNESCHTCETPSAL